MIIKTEYVCPPIPDRRWDWSAIDDGTYEPGCPVGWGRTEAEAIADLLDQLDEDCDYPDPTNPEHWPDHSEGEKRP